MTFKTCKRGPFPHVTQEDQRLWEAGVTGVARIQTQEGLMSDTQKRAEARTQSPFSSPKLQTTGPRALGSSDLSYGLSYPVTLTVTHTSRQDPVSGDLFGNISPGQLPGRRAPREPGDNGERTLRPHPLAVPLPSAAIDLPGGMTSRDVF